MRAFRTSPALGRLPLLLLAPAAAAGVLGAQEPAHPHAYGTSGSTIASYSAADFAPPNENTTWSYDGNYYRYATSATGCFLSPVHLPSGVQIVSMTLEACDTSAAADVVTILVACDTPSGGCVTVGDVSSFGSSGCSQFGSSPLDVAISNTDHVYMLQVCTLASASTTRFRTVKLFYKLRLSPAPATQTFGDVPTTHLYFRAIEALAAAGITAGCGAGNFCPEQNVTRGEMAKFLANALGLSWGP